jgi:hypothetical protein
MIERHLDQIQVTNRYVKLISEDRAFFNESYLDGRTRFTYNKYSKQKSFNSKPQRAFDPRRFVLSYYSDHTTYAEIAELSKTKLE